MKFSRLVRWILFLGLFAMAVRVSVDTDSYWHLRAGTWILDQREILKVDPFSLTRLGQAWIYPGWLAQITMALLYRWLGYAGLNLMVAILVVLAFWFVWRCTEGPELWRAFVIVLGAAVSGVYWAARPHIFSFALTGLWIFCLERIRRQKDFHVWVLPLSMVLWANLHGGFAIGFILLAIYTAGECLQIVRGWVQDPSALGSLWAAHRRRLLILVAVGLASILAVCINPHGPVMLLYPFKTVSIGVLQEYIAEWQSPNFHMRETQPFLWMILLSMVALATSGRKAHASELLALVGFGYLGFTASRNVALLGLVAVPVLSRHGRSSLQPFFDRIPTSQDWPARLVNLLNLLLAGLVLVAVGLKVAVPLMDVTNREALADRLPVAAVRYIQTEEPPGPLFNSYNWGGYVLWELYPAYLSFVDGRTDLFGDDILQEYLQVWRADPGWEAIVARWDIQLALVEANAPIAKCMQYEGWRVLYQDSQAIVLRAP